MEMLVTNLFMAGAIFVCILIVGKVLSWATKADRDN